MTNEQLAPLMEEESKPEVLYNLEKGDIIFSKSGTRRQIEEINPQGKYFIVTRQGLGKLKTTEERLTFKDLNEGIDNVAYIEHPNGQREFSSERAELDYLRKIVTERKTDFQKGHAMHGLLSLQEMKEQETRLAELEAKLN